jgi:rod shape-determining protein MreB
MIVDIGGGTTEIAVISLGGLVIARSIRVAGDKLNEDIIDFAREEYNLLLGERTAEQIKIKIGSCLPLEEELTEVMRGRDLVSGLPKEITVDDKEVRKALEGSVRFLINCVKETIEQTPPELLADIMHSGIIMAGGGGLLRKFDELLARETRVPVKLAEDPLTAVVRGTGVILENVDKLRDTFTNA